MLPLFGIGHIDICFCHNLILAQTLAQSFTGGFIITVDQALAVQFIQIRK